MYHCGVLRSYRLPVPVIVIGNLTVGGSGKTPLVLWLVERLCERGWRPGIISRGSVSYTHLDVYKRQTHEGAQNIAQCGRVR